MNNTNKFANPQDPTVRQVIDEVITASGRAFGALDRKVLLAGCKTERYTCTRKVAAMLLYDGLNIKTTDVAGLLGRTVGNASHMIRSGRGLVRRDQQARAALLAEITEGNFSAETRATLVEVVKRQTKTMDLW